MRPGSGGNQLRHALLLVQSAVAALPILDALVWRLIGGSPTMFGLAAVSALLACVPLAVAIGLGLGWRWARLLGVVYEALALVSGVANGLVLNNLDLVSVVFTLLLPVWVLWLLLRTPTMDPWFGAASRDGSTRS